MTTESEALKRLESVKHLLACPNTHFEITIQEQCLYCAQTNTSFELVNAIPALFPSDWIFTQEIIDEDGFYTDDSRQTVFSQSHQLAHINARLPIKKWCESLNITKESWFLNIGAGSGNHDLQILQDFTKNILAIDVSPAAVTLFVERQPFPCLLGTARRLPLKTDSLDGVIMSGVLHHVAGYERMAPYLQEALRVLKPGGAFISLDPNLLFPVSAIMALLDIVGQRVKPGWRHHVPHERPLVPSALRRNVTRAGFTNVNLLGTSYVHNKFPWFAARLLESMTTSLAKRPLLKHFGYWIGCSAVKPQ